ncbi:MAG TPA: TGS domain-containing protein, partial [Candidatus Fermentibacter sp.]|nr:TGS domain-containing protein [Candidatus Fermentibacter sp.]
MRVFFPDGGSREFPEGTTALDAAASISRSLASKALAARVDGVVKGLSEPLSDGVRLEILGFDSPEGREVLRHSASHLLASAILHLYPGARFGVGPAIE